MFVCLPPPPLSPSHTNTHCPSLCLIHGVCLGLSIYLSICPSLCLSGCHSIPHSPIIAVSFSGSSPVQFASLLLSSICSSAGSLCPHYSLSVFFNPLPLPLVILPSSFVSPSSAVLHFGLPSHSYSLFLFSPSPPPRPPHVKCDSSSIGEV